VSARLAAQGPSLTILTTLKSLSLLLLPLGSSSIAASASQVPQSPADAIQNVQVRITHQGHQISIFIKCADSTCNHMTA
jgi:hypothetical protein